MAAYFENTKNFHIVLGYSCADKPTFFFQIKSDVFICIL